MALVELIVGVTASFGMGDFQGFASGGGEIVEPLNEGVGGACSFAPGTGLLLRLLLHPFDHVLFRNEPFTPELDRRDRPVLEKAVDGVLVDAQFFRQPIRVSVVHISWNRLNW